jgi:zinc protease
MVPSPARTAAVAGVAIALGTSLSAAGAPPAPDVLNIPIERYTLDNGLRVVLGVDHTSPTIGVAVSYDVGSRNEEKGRTGFAHLFEHMMFQGSANLPKGEHARLVTARGGTLYGGTGPDLTLYFSTLPASELALALWLEADRMKALDVSAENFDNQREVVKEEVLGGLSGPLSRADRRRSELVYQGYWPYEHPTGGHIPDLEGAELAWVRAFHALHYGPNTAVLSIAGDIDPEAAKQLVRRYFGAIPRVPAPPFQDVPLPVQTKPRDEVMKNDMARTPAVLYGWAIPFTRHPDHYALELAVMLLGEGESARLRRLVNEGVAQSVDVALGVLCRGPDELAITVKLPEGAKLAPVERRVEAELARLMKTPPSPAEMDRLHRRAKTKTILRYQDNLTRAIWLGAYEVLYGDGRRVNDDLQGYLSVTAEDIRRVTSQYLTEARRSRVEVYPAEAKK